MWTRKRQDRIFHIFFSLKELQVLKVKWTSKLIHKTKFFPTARLNLTLTKMFNDQIQQTFFSQTFYNLAPTASSFAWPAAFISTSNL